MKNGEESSHKEGHHPGDEDLGGDQDFLAVHANIPFTAVRAWAAYSYPRHHTQIY